MDGWLTRSFALSTCPVPPCVGGLDQLDKRPGPLLSTRPGTQPSWSNITIFSSVQSFRHV